MTEITTTEFVAALSDGDSNDAEIAGLIEALDLCYDAIESDSAKAEVRARLPEILARAKATRF